MFHKAASRRPQEPVANPPLLVLLHGLASDESDLIQLAPELDARLHVVSIRAPYETGYGGFAWFEIEFLQDGTRIVNEGQAVRSRDTLTLDIRELIDQVSPSKLVLGGFSQGAMMAAGVALKEPELLDAVWLMSGRYLPVFSNDAVRAKSLPILIQHGLYDEVLSVSEGAELATEMEKAGHQVIYHEYPMAHQITLESLTDANEWLTSMIGPQT